LLGSYMKGCTEIEEPPGVPDDFGDLSLVFCLSAVPHEFSQRSKRKQ
jgi:hypothetical protein